MTLNDYFTKIICINLDRRQDRWQHVLDQCAKHNIVLERFPGIDLPGDGNRGCTESHAAVLRRIVEAGWERTLIFEDDFEFRYDDAQQRFSDMVGQLHMEWWMLYLGGHYGNTINERVSENLVRFNHMKTTSSYGVTLEAAKEMGTIIKGAVPIDEWMHEWHMKKPCFIFTPRLCVQYESFSDLQMRVCENRTCMEDISHESALGIHVSSM